MPLDSDPTKIYLHIVELPYLLGHFLFQGMPTQWKKKKLKDILYLWSISYPFV